MIYKLDSRKDCPGKLEMRLFGHDETERNRPGKQYPCQVYLLVTLQYHFGFYHKSSFVYLLWNFDYWTNFRA